MNKYKKIIGIDLGTTFSCVSCTEGGSPVVIPNREGNRTMPSIVSFDKEGKGEAKVGTAARRQAIMNPKNTAFSVKRFIGKVYDDVADIAKRMPYEVSKDDKGHCAIKLANHTYKPQQLSAKILQELKAAAEAYLGHEVTKAVITVPAYFNDQERQATKEAGQIAGLEVMRIINEPTAAALAYGLEKGDRNTKIAVYDFGGGTFDITILECEGGVFEVKGTSGDVNLGGDNFDETIMEHLMVLFEEQEGIDLRKDSAALQRLKEASEKAKKELSTAQETEINLPYITANQDGPKHLVVKLTRSKFEQLIDGFIQRSMIPCQEALKASGFSIDDIDEVVLVGGSTRVPKIQEAVAKFFGKQPSKGVNPDEVVALGAAVQGGVIAGDVKGVVLLDVTPLSLGIETLGGAFTKLIEANTTIPTKKSQIFSTAEDNQSSVMIKVFQGERPIAQHNKLLGEFFLDVPPAPRGKPQIEVTFDIDTNGIVCVSAKDKDTGKVKDIRIESSSSLTKEEIERMKQEAKVHAEEDKKAKEKMEKLNKADGAIFQMEKSLKEDASSIADDKKTVIKEKIEKMKKAYEAKDVEALAPLVKEHETFWPKVMADIFAAKQKEQQKKETTEQAAPKDKKDNEVKDAEFEEVKD